MEDVVFILLAALVLFLLLRNVLGTQSSAATAPYQASWLKAVQADAQHAVDAINATVSGASKQIGQMVTKVDRNFLTGMAVAGNKNPVAKPSAKSFQHENANTAVPATQAGLNFSGITSGIGSFIASLPINLFSGGVQGISSSAQADYKYLPAVHGVEHAVGTSVAHAADAAYHAAGSAEHFVAKQANNFTNWVGHLL